VPEDVFTLRGLLDNGGYSGSAVNGPAVVSNYTYLAAFVDESAALSNVVTDVSWHHCSFLNLSYADGDLTPDYGYGPDYNVADFYSVSMMDSLIPILEEVKLAALPLTR
jgi:hypothetical protein